MAPSEPSLPVAGAAASGTPPAEPQAPSTPTNDAPKAPEVHLAFKAVECGTCFELSASGAHGVEPYKYEWEDGSYGAARRVCAGETGVSIWVVAEDAAGARSPANAAHLQTDVSADNGCPVTPSPQPMCLVNPSFEGVPAINGGANFEAAPWSSCMDPVTVQSGLTNTPDIANHSVEPMIGIAPEPTDGVTYLAMNAGEQASQALCEPLLAGEQTSLRLDAMRMDLGTPDMIYLQLWGGSSNDCSQRQLLWASPPLDTKWTNYCLTLRPSDSVDLVTLRAQGPTSQLAVNYLAVDNITPVSACP